MKRSSEFVPSPCKNGGEGLRTLNTKKKGALLNLLLSFCQHNWKQKGESRRPLLRDISIWMLDSGGGRGGGGRDDNQLPSV